MAAPAIVAASADASFAVATGGAITGKLPAGHSSGHLLLAFVMSRGAGAALGTATDYTRLSGDNDTTTSLTAEVQAKIHDGSESDASFSTDLTASQPSGAIIIAVSGWSGDLDDLVISVVASAGSGTSMVASSADAPVNECLKIVLFCAADDNTISTPPADHDLVFSEITGTGSDAGINAYSLEVNAGATGTTTAVQSGSDPWIAYTVIISPAAGGSTVEGTALGALTLTATAAGLRTVNGSAALAATLSATAAGVRTVSGAASAAPTLTATAAGTRTVFAVAASALTLTATANGFVQGEVEGTALGALTLTATAAGTRTVSGTAAASLSLTATVAATRTVSGAAASALTLSASATGTRTVSGTATAALSLTASASGLRTVLGLAAAALSLLATATGSTPDTTVNATSTTTVTARRTSTAAVTARRTSTSTISDG